MCSGGRRSRALGWNQVWDEGMEGRFAREHMGKGIARSRAKAHVVRRRHRESRRAEHTNAEDCSTDKASYIW